MVIRKSDFMATLVREGFCLSRRSGATSGRGGISVETACLPQIFFSLPLPHHKRSCDVLGHNNSDNGNRLSPRVYGGMGGELRPAVRNDISKTTQPQHVKSRNRNRQYARRRYCASFLPFNGNQDVPLLSATRSFPISRLSRGRWKPSISCSIHQCFSSDAAGNTAEDEFIIQEEAGPNASASHEDKDDSNATHDGRQSTAINEKKKARKKKATIDFTPAWQRDASDGPTNNYKINRQKQHQLYWDEIWNQFFIDEFGNNNERENEKRNEAPLGQGTQFVDKVELFLDQMLERSTEERIVQAVTAIQHRAALASDCKSYRGPLQPSSLGPLTLVLPKFRDNLLPEEWETKELLNLLFGTQTENTQELDRSNLEQSDEWGDTCGDLADLLNALKEDIAESVTRQKDEKEMDEVLSRLMQDSNDDDSKSHLAPSKKEKKGDHFKMEAEAADKQNVALIEPPPSMVLVENLPIDVTREELDAWYGRCGPISSISIHNQRPDLDPGPLNPKQLRERRKQPWQQQRFRNKIQRPRSPVYALIEFVDRDGYEQAIGHALTVFGMIVRRHDARSVPASRLRTLYIENLDTPGTPPSEDSELSKDDEREDEGKADFVSWSGSMIEQELQEALDPIWVYISADKNPRSRRLASSCEVQFQSFEMAWHAYVTLKSSNYELFEHIHWLPSPNDAEKWWTRQRGFE